MESKSCRNCAWNQAKKPLPFCEKIRDSGSTVCDRFYPQLDKPKTSNDNPPEKCECPIDVLMNQGCQCGAEK